jgi:tetratricopeptide (TPR) repeat protein
MPSHTGGFVVAFEGEGRMAKKNEGDAGRGPERESRASDDGEILDRLPSIDPRLMERAVREFMQQQGMAEVRDPALSAAEALVFRAYETEDFEQRVRLARQAIEICPFCAEAFVCLAEVAPTARDAETIYRMGATAGESALGGASGLAGYEGRFWSDLDTRPSMRARLGLARAMWINGKHDEAIRECCQLLRLNPNDNQGVRYVLCFYYASTDQDELWQQLLDEYGEDATAEWAFSRALLAFRRDGDTPEACELLQRAHRANPHVALYVLSDLELPKELPSYVQIGGQTEAVSYATQFSRTWRDSPGSLTWMRRTLQISLADTEPEDRPSLPRLMAAVAAVPQAEGEVWQVDVRRSVLSCDEGGAPPPWTLIVTRPETNDVLCLEPFGIEHPDAKDALIQLLQCMRYARKGELDRPEVIQVQRKAFAGNWRSKLRQLGIDCQLLDELDHIDFVLERLKQARRPPLDPAESLEQRLGRLADVPIEPGEIWQADIRRLAVWVTEYEAPRRPWGALVTSCTLSLILGQKITLDEPDPEVLLDAVVVAVLSPLLGDPHLPETIEVSSDRAYQILQPHLEPLGVEFRVVPELEHLDVVYGELEHNLTMPDQATALIDTPGVTLGHVAGLFDAAAEFYRQQPWRLAPAQRPIRIRCSRFSADTWYVVVMGQAGMTLGLAMYEELEVLQSMLREDQGSERRQSAMSVMFGEAFEIPVRDLAAAEKHGWPVASPDAYPLIIRVNPGMAIRPPLNWELELAEACLRAIPPFLRQRTHTEVTMTVPTATGDVELALVWADDSH